MQRHRWARTPDYKPHPYWICPCGARVAVPEFPIAPPYGECEFPYPEAPTGESFPQPIVQVANCRRPRSHVTAYIIGSGRSTQYFSTRIFQGAGYHSHDIIAVNEAFRDWPCDWVVSHHSENVQEAIDLGKRVVTSEYICGVTAWGKARFRGAYYTYKHKEQPHFTGIDMSVFDDPEYLVMSSATVAEAIHFAYRLGVSAIALAGIDGGKLDGRFNYDGYNSGGETNEDHIRLAYPLIMNVVNEVRKRGVDVYSLNPFIDFGLEGHKYER